MFDLSYGQTVGTIILVLVFVIIIFAAAYFGRKK